MVLSERYKEKKKGEFKVKIELGYKEISGFKDKNKVKLLVLLNRNNVRPNKIFAESIHKMTLIFDQSDKANDCIDKVNRGDVCDAKAYVSNVRHKIRKGVINDWDRNMSLEELVEAIDDKEDRLISVERIMKRGKGKDGSWIWHKCDAIILTYEGDTLSNFVQVYDGACSIRMRPYIGSVIQCYRCYRYGHLAKFCKREKLCVVCGKEWHGHCDHPKVCANCGKGHRANNRKCEYYKLTKKLKR